MNGAWPRRRRAAAASARCGGAGTDWRRSSKRRAPRCRRLPSWVLGARRARGLASAAPAAVVLLPPAWTRFEPVVLAAAATRAVYRLVLYDVPVAAAYRVHEIGPWTTYWKVQRFKDMWKR